VPPLIPPSPEAFVLLDDARPVAGAHARLYRDLVGVVEAIEPKDIRPALKRLKEGRAHGLHAAGYISYEAGLALEPKLAGLVPAIADGPLLWFGLFRSVDELAAEDVPLLLPDPGGVSVGTVRPGIGRDAYDNAIDRTLALIRAGDIYQANITFRARVAVAGEPLAAYAAIRSRAAMGHGAVVRHGGRHILSFSPESFFTLDGDMLSARPMKGTARRHADPDADDRAVAALVADPKQRAENLMIVDLLRNDLSRVCRAGSVTVPRLFAVERYPTVHQMVSDVTGRLLPGYDAVDVLAALFPCGSVTGAPKIRAMEVIAAIEGASRGIYTGSIGSIDPDGNARFNVAIRTLSFTAGQDEATLGLGSGIVADSWPADEWAECLDKARFLGESEVTASGNGSVPARSS
jgi:aminodeoxychorismate synthase component I